MPSTRRQKAKARKSREVDMLSDIENMDVMLGNGNSNPIERELADAIEQSSVQGDVESNEHLGNQYASFAYENNLPRQNDIRQSLQTFSNELNLRLSQDMDSMMSMMHGQINRDISNAITERVIPEIQNILSSMSSSGNRDTEASMSPCSQENKENPSGLRSKITKKDSRSVGDLRDTTASGHYMVTGANETQQQIPEFLTGRIHSISNLERQQSNHNVSLDTTLPVPEPEVSATPQDPLNRLADVLVNLQIKPQTMTIRPVQTTPMTFDGISEKFELFEDLFHTIIKMQPAMTEQMKINHFRSLLRKGALQTFRNINSINRQTLEGKLVIFRRKYVKPESQATAKHKWHWLTFDPNTMKLPDFLEELNQGAEKAFGENAKSMIDSFLYEKLPPKLKPSVNMARLENGTYEEIVAYLVRELEFNALEESDDLPMATMASASTSSNNLLSNGINTDKDAQCSYCKTTGHFYKSCPKLKKKKELEDKNGKKPQRPTYPECPTCKKTNHPAERCWKGAGAHLRPKRTRPEDKADETSGIRNRPRSHLTLKLHLQPNQAHVKPIQKTNFATTPSFQPDVGATICHIWPTKHYL